MSVLRLFSEKLRDCPQRVEGVAQQLEDSGEKTNLLSGCF